MLTVINADANLDSWEKTVNKLMFATLKIHVFVVLAKMMLHIH
jgi:hypothetical protein